MTFDRLGDQIVCALVFEGQATPYRDICQATAPEGSRSAAHDARVAMSLLELTKAKRVRAIDQPGASQRCYQVTVPVVDQADAAELDELLS